MAAEYSLSLQINLLTWYLPPPTFPLFFLFLKAFSLRVRTTPQTFHSELYAEGLACLLLFCEHLFLPCLFFFFSASVPIQHYREHSYICHPTWHLFTLSRERWHMGCCINLISLLVEADLTQNGCAGIFTPMNTQKNENKNQQDKPKVVHYTGGTEAIFKLTRPG